MKVYFFKSDPKSYQIFPAPENVDDYLVVDIEDEAELVGKMAVENEDGTVTLQDIEVDVNSLKIRLIQQLKARADELSRLILEEYPEIEKNSFTIQKQEALSFKQNPEAPCPVLKGIADARGMELAVLVDKVLQKSQIFETVTGKIAGSRQAIMDKIEKAKTHEELAPLEAEINSWSFRNAE